MGGNEKDKFIPPHPLLIPYIVSDILEYLSSPTDIKSCRLVCKNWSIEANTILRKRRCQITMSNVADIKTLLNICEEDTKGRLSIKIGPNLGKRNVWIHSLFHQHGSRIVSLELNSASWTGIISLRKYLAEKTPNLESLLLHLSPPKSSYGHIPTWNSQNPAHELYSLKKLKTLRFQIDYQQYWSVEEQDNVKLFLRHLLSGMPNLENIHAPRYPDNFVETFQYEVQILFRESPNLRPLICLLSEPNGPCLLKLKNINVPFKFWLNITSLQQRNYPLETLNWFIGLEVTTQQINNFLRYAGKTVKNLYIDFTTSGRYLREINEEPPGSSAFPVQNNFQNLEVLELRSFKGSLKFILQIPNLKHLQLTKARDLSLFFDEESFNSTCRYPSLVSLKIDQHNPRDAVDAETLERIGTSFPNLRHLDIRFLSDAALRSIYQHFSSLEELIAVDGIFSDSGVTGIPERKLDSVVQNSNGVPIRTHSKFRRFPFIGSLKNLRKLDLRSKHITGMSAFFGLLDCKTLTSLTIMSYGFSNTSLCAIADEMSLSFFRTIFCHQLTQAGAEYIKKRMFHTELSLNELQKPLNGLDIYRLGLFQSGTIPLKKNKRAATGNNDGSPRKKKSRRSRRSKKSS